MKDAAFQQKGLFLSNNTSWVSIMGWVSEQMMMHLDIFILFFSSVQERIGAFWHGLRDALV